MTNINLIWTNDRWDCECCGTIYDTSLEVLRDGETVFSGYKDDHFGNGMDLDDPKVVLKLVLEALGYTVEQEERDNGYD